MISKRAERLSLRTPEGAAFSLRLAGPVLRLAAYAVDLAAISAAWGALAAIISPFRLISRDVHGLVAAVSYFLLLQGYFIAMEWRGRGQTLGKRLLRIRVADAAGLRLEFSQIVIRNVLRFADGFPVAYLVGAASVMLTRKAQRLGDLAAATVVVWDRTDPPPNFTVLGTERFNSLRAHPAALARLRQAVGPAEAAVASRALARRGELDDSARLSLFAEIAQRFKSAALLPPEAAEGINDERLVRNVVEVLYEEGGGAPPSSAHEKPLAAKKSPDMDGPAFVTPVS